MKNESNIPAQFEKWESNRSVLSKIASIAAMEKALKFGPGEPVIWQNQPVTITGFAGSSQRWVRTPDGRTLVADIEDLQPVAKPFEDRRDEEDDADE